MAKQRKIQQKGTLARRIQVYPPRKYFKLVMGYTIANGISESKAVNHMIKIFFDEMTEGEKIRIVRV